MELSVLISLTALSETKVTDSYPKLEAIQK